MSGLLLIALWATLGSDSLKVIQVGWTDSVPKIDGELEELWLTSDSASAFIQQVPENGKPASEPTTVYLLQDENDLYIGFRCLVGDFSQVNDRLSGEPDEVAVLIDPFDDRVNAYCFTVGFNGVESDYRVTNDGKAGESWDGVWWSAVKRHNWGYGIELVIPFKSLRYPLERREWAIDFCRYSARRNERSYWSRHDITGFRVSRMGRVTGIMPRVKGIGLEVYPVGLVRHEKSGSDPTGWDDMVQGAAGLDLAYAPTTSGRLQLTVLPDFAQIEADPYQVNLSRYELWLSERRPFFIEAVETFGGSSQPVKLFYSRRIGKALPTGRVVPIIGGVKWTDRLGKAQYGTIGVVTGQLENEPQSFYSVLAARYQVHTNSELGVLYAGKDNRALSNHGVALDGVWRSRYFTGRLFACGSQFGDSLDYAFSLDGNYNSDRWTGALMVTQIQPRFNMNGPGYTTWRGQYGTFYFGPVVYNWKTVRYGKCYGGVEISREWDYPEGKLNRQVFLNTYVVTARNHHLGLWSGFGEGWALARSFITGYAGGYYATDYTRPFSLSVYLNYYRRTANYHRMMIAPVIQSGVTVQKRFGDRLSLWFGDGITIEPDSLGRVSVKQDIINVLTPGMEYRISAKASVRLNLETVISYQEQTQRPGSRYSLFGLYSWTFAPRSKFYFATNWGYNHRNLRAIFVAKVRYLFNI